MFDLIKHAHEKEEDVPCQSPRQSPDTTTREALAEGCLPVPALREQPRPKPHAQRSSLTLAPSCPKQGRTLDDLRGVERPAPGREARPHRPATWCMRLTCFQFSSFRPATHRHTVAHTKIKYTWPLVAVGPPKRRSSHGHHVRKQGLTLHKKKHDYYVLRKQRSLISIPGLTEVTSVLPTSFTTQMRRRDQGS